jgi:acetolactate synthase regulatory subunit
LRTRLRGRSNRAFDEATDGSTPSGGLSHFEEATLLHEFTVIAENKPGTLMRVTGIITARGLNIQRLTALPTGNGSTSKIQLSVDVDSHRIHEIVKKMDRLINVIKTEVA